MDTATREGAFGNTEEGTESDAANAFLKLWSEDAEEPSKKRPKAEDTKEESASDDADEREESDESPDDSDEADDEDTDDVDDDDDNDETDEDSEKPKSPKKVIEDDNAVVKLKVDGQEVEASVKDLKRLYGQEASLTRKSQELATTRKQVEDTGARFVAGLGKLMEQAEADFEPYSKIDFLALAKDPDVTAEELTQLRKEAEARWNRVNFLKSELDATVQQAEIQRIQMLKQQAVECVKVLTDPEKGIKGWNEQTYDELRNFAIEQGLDRGIVNELVDPSAIKLLHAAMMYHKGQKAMKKTAKVDKTPKKIIKSSSTETNRKMSGKENNAMSKLRKSGTTDDAADAFLSRWTSSD
jgi:hypothetical protein